MRIALTGSTGLVGKALIPALQNAGHRVVRFVRRDKITEGESTEDAVQWVPDTGELDTRALGDIDAVVHLAGENIASGRWTKARKQRIADSRGPTTEKLCQALAALERPPATFVSASGISIYGDRGDEELREDTALTDEPDFLVEVAKAWEGGTKPLEAGTTRVAHLRIGIVLASDGGALERMLLPFRLGIGGRLGNGKHWMSWITLHDLVRIIMHAVQDESIRGPVNAIAPTPVTNRDFTKALGKVLKRPTIFPVPKFALQLLLGELSSVVLGSQRALPQRLLDSGFTFDYADIESGLRACLQK